MHEEITPQVEEVENVPEGAQGNKVSYVSVVSRSLIIVILDRVCLHYPEFEYGA